jgi:hypothetical protein
MSDYDQRQYQRMADCLESFEKAETDLHRLINDLDALRQVLEAADEEWLQKFQDEWIVMELNYARAADKGLSKLPPSDVAEVWQAVDAIKALVGQKLSEKPSA